MRTIRSALMALALLASTTAASAQDAKITIVTSFSKDVTEPLVAGFKAATPGVQVEVLNKNAAAGVAYARETASNPADLFWASDPEAFEVLKAAKLLAAYKPTATGIPASVNNYPVNDPAGFYTGFALSGYGIEYNTRYLQAKKLPVPKQWDDLKQPIYFGHVGISAPSRSGTTHLTMEALLQGMGWEKGWATMLEIGGNLAAVSERSYGVPDAVNNGQYGLGMVIDFFGLSAKASGFPIEFVYPKITALVPANVAILAGSKNEKTAQAFIEFLLSPKGQELLLDPKLSRLPVRPETYAKAPADFPNPFKNAALGAEVKFDVVKSQSRYEVVNALFDSLITYRLKELNAAWKAVHDAEAKFGGKPTGEAATLLADARKLLTTVPVSETQASDPSFASSFQAHAGGKAPAARQAEIEEQWNQGALKAYATAREKAEQAAKAK